MNIREADINDLEAWSKLRTELWPNSDDNHRSEIEEFFKGESVDIEIVYLAEIDSKVVGFIEINVRNFAEGSRRSKVPYIEAWLVDSSVRGKGIGKALIRKAEQWALSKGYLELASDTDLANVVSASIHKHLGFEETERIVCFIKSLKNA